MDIVQVVVANPVPAHGPGFVRWRGVDRASVVGLKHSAVDLVVLDDLVIASEPNRDVRNMVNEVMRDTVPDTKGGNPLLINRIPAGQCGGRGCCRRSVRRG